MNVASLLLDVLFPPECVACGVRIGRDALCSSCRIGITSHRTAFCGTCAAPLPGLRSICHPQAPYLLGAAGRYGDPSLRALIHALKFERVRSAAGPLADILAQYCARLPIDFRGMEVVPMPISRARMRERGFNQSVLIAERFARFFGMPLAADLLVRHTDRPPQSEIADRDARRANVHGCYAVKKECNGAACAIPRKVILVDDVTTSGATFFEAASALKAAGVKKIFALAAAKA